MPNKYFKIPFAENGDRVPVPDETGTTEVSFDSGYTEDYELPKTNLNRKAIERPKNNSLYHDITSNLKFWQENGAPEIVADDGTGSPLSYGRGFVGSLGGVTYVAIVEGAATVPPSAEWQEIDLSTLNQRVRFVGSISDLETLADTAKDGDAARLVSGTGRDGDFRWDASDLSSALVLASATSDSVDSGTDTINDADHPFSDGDGVITQTTVNGLTAQTVYWVVNSTSGTYQLSATFGGGAIDLAGTTNVTINHLLDPLQGIYVTPTADKTGGSGAWVRQDIGKTTIDSIDEVSSLSNPYPKQLVYAKSHNTTDLVGGGEFQYEAFSGKSKHDGYYFVSPTVPSVENQSGATHDDRVVNYLLGAGETDASGFGVFRRINFNEVEATKFPGSTLSRKIQNAFNVVSNSGTAIPATIYVSPKIPDSGESDVSYYEWDTVVDLSADSGISLKGRGTVYAKATSAISQFVQLGISNKNNQTEVSGFSLNCGDQSMDVAVLVGSCRGVKVHDIELKAEAGSFVDGIRFAGDEAHTGSEPGGGNERSSIYAIHDSGDSAVSRAIVYFTGGTSYGVKVDDIRATRGNWQNIVQSSSTGGFNGCEITNLLATFVSARAAPANAFVYIQKVVNNTKISNFDSLGVVADSCNHGVLINTLSQVSGSVYIENVGRNYAVKDVSYTGSNLISVFVNGVAYNNGDPNTAGQLFANTDVRNSGGVISDTANNTLYIGPEDFSESGYTTPLYRRITNIADDGVLQIQFDASDARCLWSVISVSAEQSTGRVLAAIAALRFSTGSNVASKLTTTADVDVTTGVLAGTTGVDGNITISASESDNSVYIENRTGASRNFNISFLSG